MTNKDKTLGNLARRMMEQMWHEIPQDLKDHAMWDVIAFGEIQPSTEARLFAAIEAVFRTGRDADK